MFVRRLSILVCAVLLAAICRAPAAQPRTEDDATRDVQQTIQARKKLLEDPHLADQNIGVIVKDRVATLWGPVPSAETAFRAELCLRTMIELVEVRSELFISEQPEPKKAPLKINEPPLYLPNQLPLPLPPPLPKEPRLLFGAPGKLTNHETGDSKKKPGVEIKAMPAAKHRLPMLGAPQPTKDGEKKAEPTLGTPAERELIAAVRAVLQSKASYRHVQFAVKENRVYVRAANEDADALSEAARAIARLPQVEGVILLEKSSSR